MRLGDTFRLHQAAADRHLKLIISDPAQDPTRVVVVSLSSDVVGEDRSCVVEAGEHPFVRHRSLVLYSRAQITPRIPTNQELDRLVAAGLIEQHVPLSSALLDRVLEGAAISGELPLVCRKILEQQGLV